MNKIYNLAQTIAADKETISKLEKHLLNAKNILAAHENAMERLTTVPSVIVSDKGLGAARGSVAEDNVPSQPARERIMYENVKQLGIEEGDRVEVVINGDPDEDFKGVYEITETSFIAGRRPITPFYLYREGQEGWYEFDECNYESEIYLIRTPEGSLNKDYRLS